MLEERLRDQIDWLAGHPQVIAAARIAHTFGMDPIAALDDRGDVLRTLVRAAAYQVVQADEKAAAKR